MSKRAQAEAGRSRRGMTGYGPSGKAWIDAPKGDFGKVSDAELKSAWESVNAAQNRNIWGPPDRYSGAIDNKARARQQWMAEEFRRRGIEPPPRKTGPASPAV